MALSVFWSKHIEAWQSSGLTQAAYCRHYGLNPNYFSGRLSIYKKQGVSAPSLIPVQIRPQATGSLILQHAKGHRLELPATQSAQWVAELLTCLN